MIEEIQKLAAVSSYTTVSLNPKGKTIMPARCALKYYWVKISIMKCVLAME